MATLGFLVLLCAFGLNFAAGQFFAPLSEAQGWSLGTVSLAAALNTVISGVAQPPLGRLIDRRGPRVVIAGSLGCMGGAYVLLAAATDVWQFVLAYGVLGGVGFAGSGSLAVAVLVSRWYERRRTVVMPRVFLGINAGQLTLVPLGGVLIEQLGYRSAYLLLGVMVLVTAVPLVALFAVDAPARVGQRPDGDGRPLPSRAPISTLRSALRTRQFWLAMLAFGVNGWTLYFTLLHLPRLARDLQGGVAAGGALIAVAAAASAVAMLASAPLVRRLGKRRVVMGLFATRALVLCVVALVATRASQLVVLAALFGVASFPVIPLMMGLIGERFSTDVLGGGRPSIQHAQGGTP
jgi:MFS family permease